MNNEKTKLVTKIEAVVVPLIIAGFLFLGNSILDVVNLKADVNFLKETFIRIDKKLENIETKIDKIKEKNEKD